MASRAYMPGGNRSTVTGRSSRDLRARSAERSSRSDFDRRRADRRDFDRRYSDRRYSDRGDFDRRHSGRKGYGRGKRGDRYYSGWKGRDYSRGYRTCRHGHYGSCYICSRGYRRSGWYVDFSWGWPYYSSWCGYRSYLPSYSSCYRGYYDTCRYYGSRYGSCLSYLLWPSYVYLGLYSGLYYSGLYYSDYYYSDYPRTYVGVPTTVYEVLPTVKLPSPAADGGEGAEAADTGSLLAPMFGGGAAVGGAFAIGEERFRRGEFSSAVPAFEESILSGTAEPSARVALALALIGAEDYSGAAPVLRIGLQELPQMGDVALDVDTLFADRTAWDDAVVRLRAAAQREPANADLALLTGFTLYAIGDLQEATVFLWSAYENGIRDAGLAEVLLAAEAKLQAR